MLRVAATLLLISSVSLSFGQSSAPKIGLKGGINFTNLYVDDVEDENMKVGFNLGLFAKLPVVRGLSIQPEVLYSSKGSKITYGGGAWFGRISLQFELC